LREKRPPKKCPPNIGADIGAITGILLIVAKTNSSLSHVI
jgi:hypothetical protein